MNKSVQRVIDRLEKVKQTGQGRFMALCPAHDDRTPSLAVSPAPGRALVYCFAGCERSQVVTAIGLGMQDLFDEPKDLTYHYDNGRTVTRHYEGLKKFFRQGNTSKPPELFQLAKVKEAVSQGKLILLCEGEEDVIAASVLGLQATTAPQGAGNWHKVDYSPLKGARVAIIADNDIPGIKRGEALAKHLRENIGSAEVGVFRSAHGKDLKDHVAAGAPFEDLIQGEFWRSSPHIAQIRQYAQAMRVSPWAVLGQVLIRIIAATPPNLVIDRLVGGYGSLNMFVALVGSSGSGKGASTATANTAIQIDSLIVPTELNIGSGEGLGAAFVEAVKGEDGSIVAQQYNESAIFHIPEIDALAGIAGRSGSIILPELRKSAVGESLGTQNRDRARSVTVGAHKYRLGLIAGVQPERSAALLNDSDGGTPQRFIWLPTTDEDAPDIAPPLPEPVFWKYEDLNIGRHNEKIKKDGEFIVMQVCDKARKAVDKARLARLRGEGAALDGHALLSRLKVAAGLALLNGRADISEEDWDLAELVMMKSDETRQSCLDTLQKAAKDSNKARAVARAEASLVAADRAETEVMRRAKDRILKKLSNDWTSSSEVRKTVSGRLRAIFEEAVDALESDGLIEVQEDEYRGQKRVQFRLNTSRGDKSSPLSGHPQKPHEIAEVKGWKGSGDSGDKSHPSRVKETA